MRYQKRQKKRTYKDGGNNYWISFSDLMSAMLLVFVLIMFYGIYEYMNVLELRTAEMLEQSGILKESQQKLDESEQLQVQQAAKLLLQQNKLEEAEQLLAQQRKELEEAQKQLDISQGELSEKQTQLEAQTAKLNALIGVRPAIISSLSEALQKNNIKGKVDPLTGAITMDSGVFFDHGSYELKQSGKDFLDKFMPVYLRVILGEPNRQYISEVLVEGHTDTTGTYMSNLALSQQRALAVANYILSDDYTAITQEERAKLREIITANGRSFSDTIKNDDGSVNMDASRRVEFKFRMKDEDMIRQMSEMLNQMDLKTDVQPTQKPTEAPAAE